MYIQIIQGRVEGTAGAHEAVERWQRHLATASSGWRSLTAGVTDGGELLAAACFDDGDDEGAPAGDPPGLGAWRRELGRSVRGAVAHSCPLSYSMKDGDLGSAGFVQVAQGRVADRGRRAAMREEVERTLAERCPHVVARVVAEHADDPGGFTEITYATSEEAVRAADRTMPVDLAVQLGRAWSFVEGLRLRELRDPWLFRAESVAAARPGGQGA